LLGLRGQRPDQGPALKPSRARARQAWGGRPVPHAVVVATIAAVVMGASTRFRSPPRFDGAGYAVLAQALASGRGYHEIDHPDRPRHDHYPPGYPFALAALWRVTGRSVAAAHLLSLACSISATLAAWMWYRKLYPPQSALLLGIALALNWTWARAGGAIQSEALFLLLGQLAVLVAAWTVRRGGVASGIVLGIVLASCMLTRHVGVCLALAIGLDLLIRRRWLQALASGLTAGVLVLPWIVWVAAVRHNTQIALLARGGLLGRVAGNLLFYMRRLPDQLSGPLVEVGTVFQGLWWVADAATCWGAIASCTIVWGWVRTLQTPRRRLAGLVPLLTIALLIFWPFTEAGRFLVPLVPFILVGAVEGLAWLGALSRLKRPREFALGVFLIASIPYTVYGLMSNRAGAQERSHAEFDAACAWLARNGSVPGPVLSRQPGEVFWLTGRRALLPPGDDLEAIDRTIDHYRVAYLFVDADRYARAPTNPLRRYVATRRGRVTRVWGQEDGLISIYAFVSDKPSESGRASRARHR